MAAVRAGSSARKARSAGYRLLPAAHEPEVLEEGVRRLARAVRRVG